MVSALTSSGPFSTKPFKSGWLPSTPVSSRQTYKLVEALLGQIRSAWIWFQPQAIGISFGKVGVARLLLPDLLTVRMAMAWSHGMVVVLPLLDFILKPLVCTGLPCSCATASGDQ